MTHGGDIYTNKVKYDFSANTSPLGTPDKVKEAIRDSVDSLSAYPDPNCTDLRRAIADHHSIGPDNIICGNGAAELIYSFAAAYRPKSALIFSPTFCEYENSLNCEISHAFDANCHYDVIYLCNPNNPTGTAMCKTDVMKYCENCDILFIDECFMDLADHPEIYSVIDELSDRIFILKAFTKSYGMAGVRLGYGITANADILRRMSEVTQTWNVSTIAQKAGIAALECADFIARSRRIISEERGYLTDELRSFGFKVYESVTNFILFRTEINLYDELLKREILIRNCGNFRGLDSTYYRCAVKKHEDNEILITTIKEILNGKS